ncbi:UDP-N-acetylglucosamine 2-epimerase (non-hydrolyzing) [Roseisolibacter sp. H3M3-2]|uniref:non-hydrolyzing UDP-N-acetylglucosamine 2-epimerase n=1 Tax=Roseisolibacter sp. H3M3-2 TaxID=3031323 RepID=UPI0023DAE2F9|nr:UDP-N-acetylglucosamine 2-epimerase (non-hydrolyzing) [Roseisolibacter sp. H3M3-2]MDF1502343.1 UDP-N-acetylglucosamine 2-epimerase (non-hydrolyzing) [Roseisolibacter sp. H3M3-2]
MKICSVIGARPQFVKAGAVSRALKQDGRIEEVLIHTGQHYDFNMSEVFFREFDLAAPRHNLGVGSGRHGAQTGKMLEGLEEVFLSERPDLVLVYGDTNSTLAGALAAAKLHVPIAHVEAGLRSFNRAMPEEINRIVADGVSDVLFAPTDVAAAQLRREGHPEERIVWTGDVMYDAALMTADVARSRSRVLDALGLQDGGYYLATVHRAENTDDVRRLASIVESLATVAETHPVVLPLHPRTRAALERSGLLARAEQALRLVEPVGFVDMVRLEMGALAVASDSGGVQKEAFFYGVPCFVLRDETEWVELVDAGWNTLVPPGDAAAMATVMLARDASRRREVRPYGDGNASGVIVAELARRLGA